MMLQLSGRTALVTGAGRGLGEAVADGLAQQGACVFGTSRSAAEAERIAARYGTSPITLDVTDVAELAARSADIDRQTGGIDLLVNNAGVNVPQAALDVTVDAWERVYATNVRGPFFLSQCFARIWRERHTEGRIVNVSSQAGEVAIPERAAYGSSKAALSHVTRVLALEWAPLGIRVNAVAPTFIETELTRSTLSRPDMAAAILRDIPLGRLGRPEEVSAAVTFLLSDEASLITGHVLVVDGGYTVH